MKKTDFPSAREPYVRQRGKAHLCIRYFDNLRRGSRLIVVARKSRRDKKHRLQGQVEHLCRVAEAAGHIVVGVVTHVGSGWDPSWIAEAAILAKEKNADAILAETTNRLIRHPCFHSSKDPDLQANDHNLRTLLHFANGVPLATHLGPMECPVSEQLYETRRGLEMSSNAVGRPRKSRPSSYQPRATPDECDEIKCLREQGLSYRQIAERTGRSRSTVQSILNRI